MLIQHKNGSFGRVLYPAEHAKNCVVVRIVNLDKMPPKGHHKAGDVLVWPRPKN